MAGADDTVGMTETDIAAAAGRQRLERMLKSFPGEIVQAMRLAQEQAEALATPAVGPSGQAT